MVITNKMVIIMSEGYNGEVRASIENDKCDVFINGEPESLLACICAIIKGAVARMTEEICVEDGPIEELGMDKEAVETVLLSLFLQEIVDNLDIFNSIECQNISKNKVSEAKSDFTQLDFSALDNILKSISKEDSSNE